MKTETTPSPATSQRKREQPSDSVLDPVAQHTDSILAFYTREERKITVSQRMLETISEGVGSPLGLGAIMLFVVVWVAASCFLKLTDGPAFDPPPFYWLQGLVGLGALFAAVVVLIKQNRLAKMEERRAHLELHVNLLTEQKVTKIIKLLEELRRDLPIKDRHDAEAAAFQSPTDPESILASLDVRLGSDDA
ncbi:MAG TPA: DUF1003 domain-containing protein [Burkholderiaceae bacterium]